MDHENIDLSLLSEGIQVLREYIFYNNLNFLKLCKKRDPFNKGQLSKIEFYHIMHESPFPFSKKNIEEIYNDAKNPENANISYRDLFIKLKVGFQNLL